MDVITKLESLNKFELFEILVNLDVIPGKTFCSKDPCSINKTRDSISCNKCNWIICSDCFDVYSDQRRGCHTHNFFPWEHKYVSK